MEVEDLVWEPVSVSNNSKVVFVVGEHAILVHLPPSSDEGSTERKDSLSYHREDAVELQEGGEGD